MNDDFALPFGGFQVHFPSSYVAEKASPLQEALKKHDALLDKADANNPALPPIDALSHYVDEFQASAQQIRTASEDFLKSLNALEFPEELPSRTKQLIFASIIAQSFGLSFEVIEYKLEVSPGGQSNWWVTGQVIDRKDRKYQGPGISFLFQKDNDEIAEGALLSACADAFIHSVYSAVPYFPWDRLNMEKNT